MSNHSPAPWHALRAPHGVIDIFDKNEHDLVTIFGDDAEKKANARLMAAAPELLEALQALRLAREQDKYRSWEKGVPEFAKAEALADAAIAKAAGD